jgi:hypothetical protein
MVTTNVYLDLSEDDRDEKEKEYFKIKKEQDSEKLELAKVKVEKKNKILGLQGQMDEIQEALETGKLKVSCVVYYNSPEYGKKMLVRKDTGEEIEEDMTETEMEEYPHKDIFDEAERGLKLAK